jgi:hypothetical protein
MPNVNGKRFPYTPEGKMRARRAKQRQLATGLPRRPLKDRLGMRVHPTTAGTSRFGEFDI